MGNFLICLFTGIFGGHKFLIEKKPVMGFIYLFTFGGFCIAWMYDCVKYYKKIPSHGHRSRRRNNIFHMPQRNSNPSTSYPRTNDYDSMEGHQFEYFCADVIRRNGFDNVEVTRGSGDHGIDILAEKDNVTYAIQCKCYSSNVGNAAVQQAHTGKSIYHKDIAVVLTNRYFTPQAKQEAQTLGVKLWDRDKLDEMIAN